MAMASIIMCQWCLVVVSLLVSYSQTLPTMFEGDECRTEEGKPGVCTVLSKCTSVRQSVEHHLQRKHVRCGFLDFKEIVCCGLTSSLQKRKCAQACEEYRQSENTLGRYSILEGKRTNQGEFPHMAALGFRRQGEDTVSWECGGTLISNQFVLTAAHCVNDRQAGPVRFVRLGTRDLVPEGVTDSDYGVEKVISHPSYKRKFYYDDIALIKLSSKVRFYVEISPACLDTETQPGDMTVIATGWGATDPGATKTSRHLLKVNLTTVEQNTCKGTLKPFGELPEGVVDTMLCASDPTGRGDTCRGDSGGPLQIKGANTITSTVVGVTSFGSDPCGGTNPSVYTRVSRYIDWIEKEVWP